MEKTSKLNFPEAVAVLSGGLDSSVALALYLERAPVREALTFDYGQHAATREIEAAARISSHFGIEHRVLTIPWLKEWAPQSGLLSSRIALPNPKRGELDDPSVTRETAAAVWVPNRNGLFIAIAAARAESLGIRGLVVGFNREEAATFPDNSRDYLEKQNRALGLSTANHVEVFAPTIELTKSQIVVEAMGLGVPLSEIWSCYWGGTVPCGACESCQRLQRALDHHHIRTAAHP